MASLDDLYITLEGILGGIRELSIRQGAFQQEVELRPTLPEIVPASMPAMDPGSRALLDQVHAGLSDLSGQLQLLRTNPPTLTPPLDMLPISTALTDVQKVIEKLPSMLNIRVGSGGLSGGSAGLLNADGITRIDPATEQTVAAILAALQAGLAVTNFPTGFNVNNFPASWTVNAGDNPTTFESQRITLAASTDTPVTFSTACIPIRVKNFDTTNPVLVKNSAISSNTDAAADVVGLAPATNLPSEDYFPYSGTTIHLRSAGTSLVVVTGFHA